MSEKMKQIQLKNFALLNVKELDERIEELVRLKKQTFENRKELYKNVEHKHYRDSVMSINSSMYSLYNSQLKILEEIKQSLIPSEKLAEVSFDKGWKEKNCYDEDDFNRNFKKEKQEFLNSNIEID